MTLWFPLVLQAMTCFEDLAPEERKRQREALRRRLAQRGHILSLLWKYLFIMMVLKFENEKQTSILES